MTPEHKARILGKIRKCFALSQSSNENEAATALRQAQALMREYDITESALLASEVSEAYAQSSVASKPAQWESSLAALVANTFGCQVVFNRYDSKKAQWTYIGCGAAPTLSHYAFEVLFRQVKKARMDYIHKKLFRCKQSNKTLRADIFCVAWVISVQKLVGDFAGSEQNKQAIDAYLKLEYADLNSLKSITRYQLEKLTQREQNDWQNGYHSGKEARLHRAMETDGNSPLKQAVLEQRGQQILPLDS